MANFLSHSRLQPTHNGGWGTNGIAHRQLCYGQILVTILKAKQTAKIFSKSERNESSALFCMRIAHSFRPCATFPLFWLPNFSAQQFDDVDDRVAFQMQPPAHKINKAKNDGAKEIQVNHTRKIAACILLFD